MRLLMILRLAAIVTVGIYVHGACAADAPGQPNIILIVVDDLGYADLSCTGQAEDVETPNIDTLAKRGVRFTDAYATSPICNASRIALMTGRYQQRQGQYWYGGPGLHDPKFPTIAEVLKQHGYATGYVGKYHHGKNDGLKDRGFPLNHGFDTFYGFSGGTKHYLHHSRKYGGGNLHEGPMWVEREQRDVEGFTTELFGEKGREFIRKQKDKPFYLHLSFNAVHNFTHQLPPAYLKEKGLKGFSDMKPGEDYWEWRQKIGYPAHPEGRAYYLGQLHLMDREIGLVLDELKTLGIGDRTAIIFVSDNGGSLVTYANNGVLKGGKYTLFEGGTRVPMIVSYPSQFTQNAVSGNIVSAMDIFPTICNLTGAAIPKGLDGVDMTPLLSSEALECGDEIAAFRERGARERVQSKQSDQELLSASRSAPIQSGDSVTALHIGQYSRPTSQRTLFWDTKSQQAVRRGKWKLLVTHSSPNGRLQIEETPKGTFLYDLEADPGETTNRLWDHPEIADELTVLLHGWRSGIEER